MTDDPVIESENIILNDNDQIEISVTAEGRIWLEAIEMQGAELSDTTQIVTYPDKIDELVAALLRAKALAS